MAALEVIALDTSVPQLMAPQAGDTYTFPRAVEMPLNTANGVLYLNGSKVVTSGSALTFDGTNFKTTGYAKAGGFTVAAGALTVFDAASGGLYGYYSSGGVLAGYSDNSGTLSPLNFDGSYLAWRPAGSEQMRLTPTGLGIGTSSPGARLNIVGSPDATFNSQLLIGNSSAVVQKLAFNPTVSSGIAGLTDGALAFYANGANTERARLDSSGNLGLGVTPSAWALPAFESQYGLWAGRIEGNVTSNAYFNGGYNYIASGIEATRYRQLTGTHAWFTAPSGTAGNAISFSQAMTLDASGNLAIGNTTPSVWLYNGLSAGSGVADAGITVYSGSSSDGILAFADGTSGTARYEGYVYYSHSTNSMRLGTGGSERARITSGGSLVVGTAALATTATDGFLYVPTCAGTPTGTPTTQTGTAPIVVDTTNNKLYFYSGGQWRDAGP